MMRIVKKLVMPCTQNNTPHGATNTGMDKYCRALAFDMMGELGPWINS